MRISSRQVVHRGALDAAGLRLDLALLGEAEARRRVLGLWTPGTQVWRLEGALLMRLPAPLRLLAERAPGLPFALREGRLCAAPLDRTRLDELAPGAWAEVRAGQPQTLPPGEPEDVAGWLDIEELSVVATRPLGLPPAAPAVVAPPPPRQARAVLGQPPSTPSAQEALQELIHDAPRAGAPTGAWLAGLLARVLGRTAPGGSAARVPWLRRMLDRMAVDSALGRLLSERHARHLRRMIDLFENGDVAEALRHAIPLSGATTGEGRLAWSPPARRARLDITPGRGPAATSPISGPDVHAYLRRLYREAFTRLEAQGRLEEAAFVLAELLGEDAEAVVFLERHDRLRLAAELAEGRGLPPGVAVRLWFLAGEVPRAVALARRTGAFADAVLRLERARQTEPAEALRLLWADDLARAGDYGAAVDVAAAVARGRGLVRAWLELALEPGGALSGRALARRLELAPELRDDTLRRIRALLDDREPLAVAARVALAQALPALPAAEGQAVTRPLVRALLCDAGRGEPVPRPAFDALLALSGDAALRSDLPAWPSPSGAATGEPWHVVAGEAGTLRVEDVTFLPSGRSLVALGEAGARLLSRDGRTLAHLDQPAHRLVVSQRGDQAIALGARGAVWRLARLDLARRTARSWCEARLDAWAPEFDGTTWYVAHGRDLIGVDVAAPRLDGPWGVGDVGRVLAMAVGDGRLALVVRGDGPAQVWEFDTGTRRLLQREDLELGPQSGCAVTPEGHAATMDVPSQDAPSLPGELTWTRLGQRPSRLPISPLARAPSGGLAVSGSRLAYQTRTTAGTEVALLDLDTGRQLALVDLPGTAHVSARLSGRLLAIGDDRGRVLVLDLDRREVLRRLRT
jgi:hypothetical protein